jgi:VWFA-related protein
MRGVRLLALLTLLVSAVAVSGAQQPATTTAIPDTPQAAFKTGVDVVSLDVSVLDSNDRPIKGLTVADFSVLEDGKPQPIVAFLPVDVPAPTAPTASWVRDVGEDVVSNDVDTRRLVVIVLDDAYTGISEGESTRARSVARAIVDQLGPADLAAVAFTFRGRAENFTADRGRLLAAIDSYSPRNWSQKNVLGMPTPEGLGVPLGCAYRC